LSHPDPPWQSRQAIIFRLAALFSGVQVAHMSDNLDGLDRWESAFERRSIGRTKILKAALIFFSEKTVVQSCTVRDVTNSGAGIIAQNLQCRWTSRFPLMASGPFAAAILSGAMTTLSACPSRTDRDRR
jgi:hypothetical protein